MRSFITIIEAAQDDVDASAHAETMIFALIKYVYELRQKSETLPVMVFSDGAEHPVIFARDVAGIVGHDDLFFMFVKNTTASRGFYSPVKLPKHGLKHCIGFGVSDFSTAGIYRALSDFGKHPTMMHEIQHYFDVKRYKGRSTPDSRYQGGQFDDPDADRAAYYNNPAEYNAFFHNIAEPLLSYLRMVRKDGIETAEVFARPIDPDFRAFLRDAAKRMSRAHARAFDTFDETYRRRMLKRLFALHQEVMRVKAEGDGSAG